MPDGFQLTEAFFDTFVCENCEALHGFIAAIDESKAVFLDKKSGRYCARQMLALGYINQSEFEDVLSGVEASNIDETSAYACHFYHGRRRDLPVIASGEGVQVEVQNEDKFIDGGFAEALNPVQTNPNTRH